MRRFKMYQRILVAVDGSDISNLALREAMKLAKDQRAMLRLVHVVDESLAYVAADESGMANPGLIDQIRNALRAAGQNVLSASAAVVRAAGLEADTTMKMIEAAG